MKFKTSLYRRTKPEFIKVITRIGYSGISLYCATSGYPIAAALIFYKEEFPEYTDEINKRLQVIKEFYGYDEIEET